MQQASRRCWRIWERISESAVAGLSVERESAAPCGANLSCISHIYNSPPFGAEKFPLVFAYNSIPNCHNTEG